MIFPSQAGVLLLKILEWERWWVVRLPQHLVARSSICLSLASDLTHQSCRLKYHTLVSMPGISLQACPSKHFILCTVIWIYHNSCTCHRYGISVHKMFNPFIMTFRIVEMLGDCCPLDSIPSFPLMNISHIFTEPSASFKEITGTQKKYIPSNTHRIDQCDLDFRSWAVQGTEWHQIECQKS